jgi:hypothetical protein
MEFHFIITLLFPGPKNGLGYLTRGGTVSARPGQTRQDLYNQVWSYLRETVRDVDISHANTVFFSLEPNELPSAV